MDSNVHASLHPNCHHQIVYAKSNLKAEYPPLITWKEQLLKSKNGNEQLYLFNKTMLNIFHNFIPNKNTVCKDKDPPWFNNQNQKTAWKEKSSIWLIEKAIWLGLDWPSIVQEGAKLLQQPREKTKQPKQF